MVTMSTRWISAGVLLVLSVGVILATPVNKTETVQCEYGDGLYGEGEIVTGDPCDHCLCTPMGVMCSYISCGQVKCVDAVRRPGQCCPQCPNGPNAYFLRGDGEKVLVPCMRYGCKLNRGTMCFCYRSRAYCYPPFPFDFSPSCFPNGQ